MKPKTTLVGFLFGTIITITTMLSVAVVGAACYGIFKIFTSPAFQSLLGY